MWNNNEELQVFKHPNYRILGDLTSWFLSFFFPCCIFLESNSLLKQTNKQKNRNCFGNLSYPGWHLFQLNDESVVDLQPVDAHLYFILLRCEPPEAASMFENSSDISLFRQNIRLFNCIFNCLVRQRLIALTHAVACWETRICSTPPWIHWFH